jgi:hypothetical protein
LALPPKRKVETPPLASQSTSLRVSADDNEPSPARGKGGTLITDRARSAGRTASVFMMSPSIDGDDLVAPLPSASTPGMDHHRG